MEITPTTTASSLKELVQSLTNVLRSDSTNFQTRSVVGWIHGVLLAVPHHRVVRNTTAGAGVSSSTTSSTTTSSSTTSSTTTTSSSSTGAQRTLLEQCVALVRSGSLSGVRGDSHSSSSLQKIPGTTSHTTAPIEINLASSMKGV